jgi:metal-responsive CopG/Arc/MetJ family transcriptional regulator
MATVNFSVPEDVNHQFDKVFAGKNKSEVLTQLMQQAIKEQKRLGRRRRVINCLLALREQAPRVTDKGTRLARTQGRP